MPEEEVVVDEEDEYPIDPHMTTEIGGLDIPQVGYLKYINKREIPLVKKYLQNEEVVQIREVEIDNLTDDFWTYLEKSVAMTRWENRDIPRLLIWLDRQILIWLMGTIDEEDFTYEMEHRLESLKIQVFANIKKGVDMWWSRLSKTNIAEYEQSTGPMGLGSMKKQSLKDRLFRKKRGGY